MQLRIDWIKPLRGQREKIFVGQVIAIAVKGDSVVGNWG
jgi:hypothetical protein